MRAAGGPLADDTNFDGSDADFKGDADLEAQEKARNDTLIDRLSISCEGSESGPL